MLLRRAPESDPSLLTRQDSTQSAMRCLLASSQEENSAGERSDARDSPAITPETNVSPTNSEGTSNDADLSTVTDTDSQQDGETTASYGGESAGSQSESPPQNLDSGESKHEASHLATSSKQQAEVEHRLLETKTSESDQGNPAETDIVTHDEHVALVLNHAKGRVSLRTRSPRLFRHGCQLHDSFCEYSGNLALYFHTATHRIGIYTIFTLFIIFFSPIANIHQYLRAGIDDGNRLAATGVVWYLFNQAFEVVFTGSLGWKNTSGRGGNQRSQNLSISGPHFVFIRPATLLGRPIVWADLLKLHAQTFFNEGEPDKAIGKSTLFTEARLVRQFLRAVEDPKCWYTIDLLRTPKSDDEPTKPTVPRTRKRSRRLLEMRQKTQLQSVKEHNDRENKKRDEELKMLRAEAQRRRRDMKKFITSAVAAEVTKVKEKLEKAVERSMMKKIQKVVTSKMRTLSRPLQVAVSNVDDMSRQLDDDKAEMTNMVDKQNDRFDKMFKELEQRVKGVVHLVSKLRDKADTISKRSKKRELEFQRLTKKVEKLTARSKRRKRSVVQPVSDKPKTPAAKEAKEQVAVAPPAVTVLQQRPPTPMVPPPANNQWFHMGDTHGSRAVSPTPTHFVSPMYASRNFIR